MTNHDEQMKAVARLVSGRPDWLDAPAVQAWHRSDGRTEHDGTPGKPRIWSPDYRTTERWSTPSLRNVHWSDLVDVVPLAAPAGSYTRTDETTGEALARLQAEMTRLLDEADAELRDEADGGVTAALIEKEAEARATTCTDKDAHWRLDEALETIERLTWERDEARATKDMHKRRADEERARAEKAEKERDAAQHVLEEHRCGEQAERAYRRAVAVESRALTPDDVRRALDVAVESFASSCPPDDEPYNAWKVRQATWEALRELFPNVPQSAPARPDGAEQIRPILAEYAKESALRPVTAPGLDLADFLAERGVRAPEGGAA